MDESPFPAVAPMPLRPLYRVAELTEVLPFGKSFLYELVASGRLRTVREGCLTLVPAAAIGEYVALLEREARGPASGQKLQAA